MKNIERPEVQKSIAFDVATCFANTGESLIAHAMDNKESRVLPSKVLQWLNSEYTEPHKWEPWELEAMRNIPKRIVYLERRHDTSLPRALQKEDCYSDHGICTQINFPSLKNEKIDIDAELERNGMHR